MLPTRCRGLKLSRSSVAAQWISCLKAGRGGGDLLTYSCVTNLETKTPSPPISNKL